METAALEEAVGTAREAWMAKAVGTAEDVILMLAMAKAVGTAGVVPPAFCFFFFYSSGWRHGAESKPEEELPAPLPVPPLPSPLLPAPLPLPLLLPPLLLPLVLAATALAATELGAADGDDVVGCGAGSGRGLAARNWASTPFFLAR